MNLNTRIEEAEAGLDAATFIRDEIKATTFVSEEMDSDFQTYVKRKNHESSLILAERRVYEAQCLLDFLKGKM